jgi:3-hydroxyacyl-CoA dehydrogenase
LRLYIDGLQAIDIDILQIINFELPAGLLEMMEMVGFDLRLKPFVLE